MPQLNQEHGVSLIDMMVAVAVMAVIMAGAVPQLRDVAGSMKLGSSLRDVERELQTARLKAVTSNRPIRVRFNCPATGQFRMVELIGSPSAPAAQDSALPGVRCSETNYPSPPADTNPLTRPNHEVRSAISIRLSRSAARPRSSSGRTGARTPIRASIPGR